MRQFLIVMTLLMAAAVSLTAYAEPVRMSAAQAHARAAKGEILLLDIRRPAEWKQTGIGTSARPVSMHQPGFLARVKALTGGDTAKPVALICARGGRSTAMQKELARAGYTSVINVAEGMLGGPNGPGWIKSGLPTKPYAP